MSNYPSLCRAVIYVDNEGTEHAAVVSHVPPDNGVDDLLITLHVFKTEALQHPEHSTVQIAAKVPYSETPKPRTWHWPPRV